jgi:hypothetical protein
LKSGRFQLEKGRLESCLMMTSSTTNKYAGLPDIVSSTASSS